MCGPKPPDPKETSAAQTGTNVSTAVANAMMGNVNQITPDGSLTYDQTGSYSFTDPYTGHTYDIPTFTATQMLSPEQQAIQTQLTGAKTNLANIANQQSGFLRDYLSSGVDTSNVPGLIGSARLNNQFSGDIGGGYNTEFSRGLMGNYDTNFSRNIGKGYDTKFSKNIGGSFSDKLGGNYSTSVDLATSYAGADDFSADRQRYEDALWSRGEGDRIQAQEALRGRLLNSGIREGSAAWNSEMERLARQESDARLGTYLAAGDEQARMVNLARDAAIFGNDANLAMANFGNTATANRFQLQNNAALQRAQFGREGQLAGNQAALAQAQFGQNAQQLGNAASLAQSQFARDGQLAQNAAALAQAQFGSQQQQASNAARLAGSQFQNAARTQGMQEAYAARSQPINEIIGLMSGSQVQQPNFVNANMPTIPTTQNAEIINDHYAQQLAATPNFGGLLTGIGGGIGKLIGLSDERSKKDVKKRGEIDGMGLYEFRYKGEPKSQSKHVGLMAQEVKKKRPEAIVPTSGGLMAVDYGKAIPGLMGGRQASK